MFKPVKEGFFFNILILIIGKLAGLQLTIKPALLKNSATPLIFSVLFMQPQIH